MSFNQKFDHAEVRLSTDQRKTLDAALRVAQAPDTSAPLVEREMEKLEESIAELSASVDWLLQKIEPICTRSSINGVGGKAEQMTKDIAQAPSALRGGIIALREKVEGISGRISPVRYTIEI